MNRPKIVVKNGLKPIKQAKTEYLKRKPARERGLFVWEILGMQYGISVLKRRVGYNYINISKSPILTIYLCRRIV